MGRLHHTHYTWHSGMKLEVKDERLFSASREWMTTMKLFSEHSRAVCTYELITVVTTYTGPSQVKMLAWNEECGHEDSPSANGLLEIDGYWERRSQFSSEVTPKVSHPPIGAPTPVQILYPADKMRTKKLGGNSPGRSRCGIGAEKNEDEWVKWNYTVFITKRLRK